jgi:hypothetical protein
MNFENNFIKENITTNKNINSLMENLKVLYGDSSESQRFKAWIEHLNINNKLKLFTDSPSAFKTPYYTEDWPDIIIKKFDKFDNLTAYETEKNDFEIIKQYLGDRFLPKTEYVEISGSHDENNKYYVVQDKIQGRYQQDAADEAIKDIHNNMSEDEINKEYVEKPDNWVKFRGEIFKKGLTPEQWQLAKIEAAELENKLKALEEKYLINDLDYFVTPEGKIKIIDFQLHIKDDKNIKNDFPVGSEEIKLFFDL